MRVVLLVVVVVAVVGCNKRVFRQVEQSCDSTIPVDVDIPTQKAADILIVVDNSGSMQEEQDRLAQNFINLDPSQCPLQRLDEIPDELINPAPSLYEPGGRLSQCGFIQLLAAFDNDFRVGVITTDVGLYDNRLPQAQAALCVGDSRTEGVADGHCAVGGAACNNRDIPCENTWGFHPQRGCLQPDGDPATPGVHKFISRADLFDDDDDNNGLAERFSETLANIRTFGSPYERGLDAMSIFLDPASTRAPTCEDDLVNFRRADAQLVVIFLSDEEDCSHGLAGADFPFDELADETQGPGEYDGLFGQPGPDRCYADKDELPPVAAYAAKLKAADAKAKVAVIAGLVPNAAADGGFEAGSCLAGTPPSTQCFPSGGQSNATQGFCAPGAHAEPCCVADAGSRYVDFARGFAGAGGKDFLLDSICDDSFRTTMIQVAAFIGSTNLVNLVEPPKDGVVVVTENGATVERISEEECATQSGFYLKDETTIVFCRDAIPGPGSNLSIRAKGQADTEACKAAQ